MANFRVDVSYKDRNGYLVELQLIRVLDNDNKKDQNEAYRNAGIIIDRYSFKQVGKYKDRNGFIYYRYM